MSIRFILSAFLCMLICPAVLPEESIPISILYFDDLSRVKKHACLAKALTEMLIGDLSDVKGVSIIEREQIEKAFSEMALGQTGAVDDARAPRVGRLLGAHYLVMGSYMARRRKLIISYKIVGVEKGNVLASGNVTGKTGNILGAKNDLAEAVAADLEEHFEGVTAPELKRGNEVISTDKMTVFGRALDYKDKQDFKSAGRLLRSILGDIPDYEPFRKELSEIQRRLEGYDEARRQALDERHEQPATYRTFLQTTGSYASSMQYTRLLNYCRELRASPPRAPEGSAAATKELIDYYIVLSLHSLKRWHEMVEEGEHFLKAYPASMHYNGVKRFLARGLNELKSRDRRTARASREAKPLVEQLSGASVEQKQLLYYRIGTVYLAEGMHAEALNWYRKLDLKKTEEQHLPGDTILMSVFMCYYHLRQRAEAEKVIETTARLYPESDAVDDMRRMMTVLAE